MLITSFIILFFFLSLERKKNINYKVVNLFKNYKVGINNKFYNPILFSFVRKKKEYIVYILILFSF